MNHQITQDQVELRLSENGLEYTAIRIGAGVSIVVSRFGGRIFGPFLEGGESVTWLNEAFKSADSFSGFLESDEWNLGGDRVWIAPEHRFNMADRLDLFNTYKLPKEVDPGIYKLTPAGDGCRLSADSSLPVYGPAAEPKRLSIDRLVRPAADPLREIGNSDKLAVRLTYAGFTHQVTLTEFEDDGIPAELWDLAQVNPGGTAYAVVLDGDSHTDFYEPVDGAHYQVFQGYSRLLIDAKSMFKVGYKAAQFLGRVAYHNTLGDGTEYLHVRALFSNPSATYTMEPPEVVGDRGYPVQIFNDNGLYGGFGEIECSGQAIGGETGRSSSVDQICNWFYFGPREAIASAGRVLLGATVDDWVNE